MKRIFLSLLLLPGIAVAQDKPPKTYPEHGTVVALRQERETKTLGVYTDPYGKTHGGQSIRRMVPVARIETETRFYELEGKGLQFGQAIEFRIEEHRAHQHAYVREADGKERRYIVVAIEQKPDKTKQ